MTAPFLLFVGTNVSIGCFICVLAVYGIQLKRVALRVNCRPYAVRTHNRDRLRSHNDQATALNQCLSALGVLYLSLCNYYCHPADNLHLFIAVCLVTCDPFLQATAHDLIASLLAIRSCAIELRAIFYESLSHSVIAFCRVYRQPIV